MRIIYEPEFYERIFNMLKGRDDFGWVTGPGRSGAIAAVYASHMLKIPFVPFGAFGGSNLGKLLIIDTAMESGKTLRKASNKYKSVEHETLFCFDESKGDRVAFWYESDKPQYFKHETKAKMKVILPGQWTANQGDSDECPIGHFEIIEAEMSDFPMRKGRASSFYWGPLDRPFRVTRFKIVGETS